MSIRWRITDAEHDALDADLQGDYERDGENWLLVVEESTEDDSRVMPPEQREDSGPLKRAFEAEKIERDKLRAQVRDERAARASGDDGAVLKLRQKQFEESEQRLAQIAADGQAAVDAQKTQYEPQIAEVSAQLEKVEGENDELVLKHGLHRTIRAQRGYPELLEDRMRKLVKIVRGEDGRRHIVGVDSDGNVRINPETLQPVGADQVLAELREFEPALRVAFEPSGNGNNGGAPTQG